MGVESSNVKVDIHRLAAAPVGDETPGSIQYNTFFVESDEAISSFEGYIDYISMKGDISKVTHGSYKDGSLFKQQLEDTLSIEDNDEFIQILSEWAESLNEKIIDINKSIPGRVRPGHLFLAQATLDGGNIDNPPLEVTCLLKLDREQSSRPYLEKEEKVGAIPENSAYPSRDQVQKVAIYPGNRIPPHSRNGDIKVYQSSPSDYFEEFLEYSVPLPSSLEQAREVINESRSHIQDSLDRELEQNDFSEIVSEANNNGKLDPESIGTALENVSNGELKKQDIIDSINKNEELRDLQIDADDIPTNIKLTAKNKGESATIKYPQSMLSSVTIVDREDGQGKQIVIDAEEVKPEFMER